MEGLFFNVNYGYIEGIVRGYRNALLTTSNYNNLTQCETIDDLKLQLGPAYGDYLSSLPPNPSTTALAQSMTNKLVSEWKYVYANATGTLAKFMEYLVVPYQIDNCILLATGTVHERDSRDLLERCHPLGWFETLPVLVTATTVEELYNSVLIESPLAPYFKGALSHQDLDELNIEIIRNTLYKGYLEDFYNFVNTDPELAGTPTAEAMSEIINFQADTRAINITINSFGTELSAADRKKLYPNIGKLWPSGTLMLSRAEDIEGVRLAVDGVGEYKSMFDTAGLNNSGPGNMSGGNSSEGKSLEDMFRQKEMEMSKLCFSQQFSCSILFAFLKLKENEVNNITWVGECIAQAQKDRINDFISVF